MKMARTLTYFLRFSVISCIITRSLANEIAVEDSQVANTKQSQPSTFTFDQNEVTNEIEAHIEKIEYLAAQAEKAVKDGILPEEHSNKLHSNIEETVEELVDILNETTNIYKFLSAKGIERIVLPNIGIKHPPLKRQLLLLIKNLFNVAPITTNAVIPVGVVDKVLDIFEHDNLALKAHALDVLCLWLPNDPIIQTRVMKMKGLEPFYKQIPKLDAEVVGQLLELFNKILVEHMQARKKDMHKSKADNDKFILYQRIGLIERLSTPVACNGLLRILETTWSFNTEEKDISKPIIETVTNVQPLCINFFKAKPKHTKLFYELLKYIDDPIKKNKFEKLGLNVTGIRLTLKNYSNVFKDVKDEF